MGLLDKVRKIKELGGEAIPPMGKPVTVKSEEEFLESCRELTGNFIGTMLLSGDIDGERYSASLLLDKGNIAGSTFEFRGLITFREQAIEEIKNKLKGSSGILNIFEFDEGDMEFVRDENKSALLEHPIPLNSLGMKIKFLMEKWAKEREAQNEGVKPINLSDIFKVERRFNLIELARTPEKLQNMGGMKSGDKGLGDKGLGDKGPGERDLGGAGDLLKAIGGTVGDKKLEELRRIKEEREKKIADRLARVKTVKEPKKTIKEGKKLRTTIDRLYSLVKKYKRIRIDDRLAGTLGVTKTQIEEWSVILEEHGLLELHYPTIGEPEIRIKDEREKS